MNVILLISMIEYLESNNEFMTYKIEPTIQHLISAAIRDKENDWFIY